MPSKGGIALRSGDSFLRILEFLCAAVLLGIFSYFLAYLHTHHQHIPTWMRAVEGISGAAVIYTAFATLLTCFLGGITFFALLAILLDVLFLGGFIAIVVLARGGVHTGGSYSPLGNGRVRDAKFQTAAFAIAIIGAFLFLITALFAVLLNRHHKKEKVRGPSPSNNYTSGSGKKSFFKRSRKSKATRDAELGAVGGGTALIAEEKAHHNGHHHDNGYRPSDDTAMTGTTAAVPEPAYGGGAVNKYNDGYSNPQREHEYNAYNPQVRGATGKNNDVGYLAPDRGVGSHMNQERVVIHDPQPYAEVHGSGLPHQAKMGGDY